MSRRRVVVTGAGSGLGRCLALGLSAEWDVIGVDRESAPIGVGVEMHAVDVTDSAQLESFAAHVRERHGGIDALVHCAGIAAFGAFLAMERATWEHVLRVNLHGTLATVQAMAPVVRDGGRVVLFSSGTAFKGPGGAAAYAASKGGVIAFARCLAEELGERQITVNTIAPGLVRTPLSESIAFTEEANIATRAIKRAATPEDYLAPVRLLLDEGSGFVTGQTLVVDGGSIRH